MRPPRPLPRIPAALLFVLLLALALARPAHAGGGPERTVVVVNADSPVSLRVAHDYARRRAIPPSHLIYLEGVPTLRVVDLPTFRTRLWEPVKKELEARGLLEHVDLLAWSADFPFGVDVAEEAKAKGVEPLPHVPFRAALTGLTYFWRHVEAQDPARYLDLGANRYFHPDATTPAAAPQGRQLTAAETALARSAAQALQKKDYAAARDAYLELLKQGPDLMGAWYDLACCHARLGEGEAALEALGEAVKRGWSDALHTLGDPDLESLRTRPAFQALIERMNAMAGTRGRGFASHGFGSQRIWAKDGSPVAGLVGAGEMPRDTYLLSVMLGVTGEWGNSLPEVLTCLERGAASDGTHPDGTVYLLANDDVRADTRERYFPFTLELLQGLGRKAALLTKGQDGQDGNIPKGKTDIVGAVLGTAGFTWKGSESTLLPGAIVEHLTSFGADFSHGSQTKLSELIRAGAAGSSGTVAEPLALWQKFPLPAIHAHYARGCSLAEAFYQSMAGPWQTLVVGDPLARPFARFHTLALKAPAADAPVTGSVALEVEVGEPKAGGAGGASEGDLGERAAALELWVDGRFVTRGARGEALAWDTTKEDDGAHEVRVVHVAPDAIETRSHVLAWINVANAGRAVTLLGPKEAPAWGAKVQLSGKVSAGGKPAEAVGVDLLLGARVVATAPVKAGAFKAEVDTLVLGPGKVALVARARFADGPAARSLPLDVEPAPGAATGATAKKPTPPKPPPKPKKPKDAKEGKDAPAAPPASAGLVLRVTDDKKKVHEGTLPALSDEALTKALADLKVPQPASLEIVGQIEVPEDGLYQLILTTSGALEVTWAGQRALEAAKADGSRLCFAAAYLKAGWNPLALTLVPQGTPRLAALLGGQTVTAPIAPTRLKP